MENLEKYKTYKKENQEKLDKAKKEIEEINKQSKKINTIKNWGVELDEETKDKIIRLKKERETQKAIIRKAKDAIAKIDTWIKDEESKQKEETATSGADRPATHGTAKGGSTKK